MIQASCPRAAKVPVEPAAFNQQVIPRPGKVACVGGFTYHHEDAFEETVVTEGLSTPFLCKLGGSWLAMSSTSAAACFRARHSWLLLGEGRNMQPRSQRGSWQLLVRPLLGGFQDVSLFIYSVAITIDALTPLPLKKA